jgi:hypothetical protein
MVVIEKEMLVITETEPISEGEMAYNPELIRQIEKVESLVKHVDSAIGETSSISPVIKSGLTVTLQQIKEALAMIKDITSSPVDSDTGKIVGHGVAGRPEIELDGMTLRPAKKEVDVAGRTVRLPRAEFVVLYELALRAGQEVLLGPGHSILTRMSNIRRAIPEIKPKIEALGRGRYVLHLSFKK